jgi:hypothetical protein
MIGFAKGSTHPARYALRLSGGAADGGPGQCRSAWIAGDRHERIAGNIPRFSHEASQAWLAHVIPPAAQRCRVERQPWPECGVTVRITPTVVVGASSCQSCRMQHSIPPPGFPARREAPAGGRRNVAASSPSVGLEKHRRSRPVGKSAKTCQAPLEKIFWFSEEANHLPVHAIPSRKRGVGHRHERWDGLRWTRAALLTNGADCGRRSRVVLTPRCWRQVCSQGAASDGGKKADRRGDHGGSR